MILFENQKQLILIIYMFKCLLDHSLTQKLVVISLLVNLYQCWTIIKLMGKNIKKYPRYFSPDVDNILHSALLELSSSPSCLFEHETTMIFLTGSTMLPLHYLSKCSFLRSIMISWEIHSATHSGSTEGLIRRSERCWWCPLPKLRALNSSRIYLCSDTACVPHLRLLWLQDGERLSQSQLFIKLNGWKTTRMPVGKCGGLAG